MKKRTFLGFLLTLPTLLYAQVSASQRSKSKADIRLFIFTSFGCIQYNDAIRYKRAYQAAVGLNRINFNLTNAAVILDHFLIKTNGAAGLDFYSVPQNSTNNFVYKFSVSDSNYSQISQIAVGSPNFSSASRVRGLYSLRLDGSLWYQALGWSSSLNKYILINAHPYQVASQILNCTSLSAGGQGLLFWVIDGILYYQWDLAYFNRSYGSTGLVNIFEVAQRKTLQLALGAIQKVTHGGDDFIYIWLGNGDIYRIKYQVSQANLKIISLVKITTQNFNDNYPLLALNSGIAERLSGYAWPLATAPGGSVNLHISSSERYIKSSIIRYNWNGLRLQPETLYPEFIVECEKFTQMDVINPDIGFDWGDGYQVKLPSDMRPGYYFFLLKDQFQNTFQVPFIVKASSTDYKLTLLAGVNTWYAYNTWGISGNYGEDLVATNSFKRPINILPTEFWGGPVEGMPSEIYFSAWLAYQGISFNVITDIDLDASVPTTNCLLFPGHSEYWTLQARTNLNSFLSGGGSVANFSGNCIYEKIDYSSSKQGALLFTKYRTFRSIGLNERKILGVAYESAASGSYAPFAVINSNHWVFNNTSLSTNALFGQSSFRSTQFGASGGEFDTIGADTPTDYVLLAKGQNAVSNSIVGADMLIRNLAMNNYVFSASSTNFTFSILTDVNCSIIAKNVINKLAKF
jgi:hypothetical protein